MSTESTTTSESEITFDIPPFAAGCHQAARSSWNNSYDHPFLKALLDGTLDRDRFRFYQMQDARYLETYADACSLISVRMVDPERKLWFIEAARLALVVERELHEEYGRKLGYTADDIARLELTPNNRAYQNHLLSTCQNGSLLEAVAALAPCPWLYAEVGSRITGIDESHPYHDWLKTYADQSFILYTNELLEHLEFLASQYGSIEHQTAAREAFVLSSRYEWMFWDQAWTSQRWPDVGVRDDIGKDDVEKDNIEKDNIEKDNEKEVLSDAGTFLTSVAKSEDAE